MTDKPNIPLEILEQISSGKANDWKESGYQFTQSAAHTVQWMKTLSARALCVDFQRKMSTIRQWRPLLPLFQLNTIVSQTKLNDWNFKSWKQLFSKWKWPPIPSESLSSPEQFERKSSDNGLSTWTKMTWNLRQLTKCPSTVTSERHSTLRQVNLSWWL